MKAELVIRERRELAEDAFVEAKIWRVPEPVRGSGHTFKYSLAFVVNGECIIRYDNQSGRGDHVHRGPLESPYDFITIDRLVDDFMRDARRWLKQRTS